MTKASLSKLKKNELFDLCKKMGIKIDSKAKKEEIVNAILLSEKSQEKKSKIQKEKAPKSKKEKKKVAMEEVEKTKYESSKGELKDYETKKDLEDVLPQSYNEDRIVLLVRDPHFVYTYWDFSKKTRETYGLDREDAKIILRTYNMDGKYFDVELSAHLRNCYFQVPESGKKYYTELGTIHKGKFVVIAKSNTISVPKDYATLQPEDLEPSRYSKASEIFRMSGGYMIKKLVGSEIVEEWRGIGAGEWSGVSSGSGGFSFARPVESDLKAELNMELVMYGATTPEARVTIGGIPVELSSNGNFSIRFYLKDGEFTIPFVAVSPDGKKRIEIIPTLKKTTIRKEM